jgi:peptide/nickel transport system ATP-binding protein
MSAAEQYLAATGLTVRYGSLEAVRGVSFRVERGNTIGIVGESGSGKSTVARACVGLEKIASGDVVLDGRSIAGLTGRRQRAITSRLQLIFQDPSSALNPRMTVRELLEEPIIVHRRVSGGAARRARVRELLDCVRITHSSLDRFPSEFSGGQKQRIAIARALAVEPEFLILDEVTSALDVSVQAVMLNLLIDLQAELNLGYVFISHNLAVIRVLCDEVMVMNAGQVVEHGSNADVFGRPGAVYTRELIAAVPRLRRGPTAERIEENVE